MVLTITVLNQKKVPGVGLFTTGRMNYSGAYTVGGESNANLLAALKGYNTIDSINFMPSNNISATYDSSTQKVRMLSNVTGVGTELAGGNTPAPGSVGFSIISR